MRLSISPMIDQMTGQMNFSRECNTLYMASSPRAKSRTLSQLLWLFSMYQSAFLCEYISSNVYFMLSNQQTGSTDQSQGFFSHFQDKKLSLRLPPFARCFLTRSVGTFGVLLLCKQGAGFQPRLQFPPLFCIVLSANQV